MEENQREKYYHNNIQKVLTTYQSVVSMLSFLMNMYIKQLRTYCICTPLAIILVNYRVTLIDLPQKDVESQDDCS